MKENDKHLAWWEKSSKIATIIKSISHPFVVLRQIGVACDFSQSPQGSTSEEFPTLNPKDAAKLLEAAKRRKNWSTIWSDDIEAGERNPERGDVPKYTQV